MSMLIQQNMSTYKQEDHETWGILFERQMKTVATVSKRYLKGHSVLELPADQVVNLAELNKILFKHTGWQTTSVRGLVPTKSFFEMLHNQCFPVTVFMRSRSEIDFSELPDIFHDVFGHVPMLLDETFIHFMKEFSRVGLKHIESELAVVYLSRLYWFTLETGLIHEDDVVRPYGAAIMTSKGEVQNIADQNVIKRAFDIHEIIKTPYDNFHLQKEYFVIESFDQILEGLKHLETILDGKVVPVSEPLPSK